jgi:hypothetical protein
MPTISNTKGNVETFTLSTDQMLYFDETGPEHLDFDDTAFILSNIIDFLRGCTLQPAGATDLVTILRHITRMEFDDYGTIKVSAERTVSFICKPILGSLSEFIDILTLVRILHSNIILKEAMRYMKSHWRRWAQSVWSARDNRIVGQAIKMAIKHTKANEEVTLVNGKSRLGQS